MGMYPVYSVVRKHRAPKGALRLHIPWFITVPLSAGQKAPSAKRCIKTPWQELVLDAAMGEVRKHRAPKGALRQGGSYPPNLMVSESESTERQKVH